MRTRAKSLRWRSNLQKCMHEKIPAICSLSFEQTNSARGDIPHDARANISPIPSENRRLGNSSEGRARALSRRAGHGLPRRAGQGLPPRTGQGLLRRDGQGLSRGSVLINFLHAVRNPTRPDSQRRGSSLGLLQAFRPKSAKGKGVQRAKKGKGHGVKRRLLNDSPLLAPSSPDFHCINSSAFNPFPKFLSNSSLRSNNTRNNKLHNVNGKKPIQAVEGNIYIFIACNFSSDIMLGFTFPADIDWICSM